jgi:hypothetical protein
MTISHFWIEFIWYPFYQKVLAFTPLQWSILRHCVSISKPLTPRKKQWKVMRTLLLSMTLNMSFYLNKGNLYLVSSFILFFMYNNVKKNTTYEIWQLYYDSDEELNYGYLNLFEVALPCWWEMALQDIGRGNWCDNLFGKISNKIEKKRKRR